MRGHNEGSISAYSAGRVQVRVTMRDGTRRARTISGPDEKDVVRRAKAELRRLLAERDAGLLGSDSLLGPFLTSWVREMHGTVAAATWERYAEHVERVLIPKLARTRVGELRVEDVERMLDGLAVGGRTKRHVRATLRRALTDAQRRGMVNVNVAALARAPAVRVVERTVLDADQAKALIAALEGHPLHAFFVLALHTGAREAELLGLRWHDVEGDVLYIRRTLHRVWTGERSPSGRKIKEWKLAPPKNDRSRRAIHLTPAAVAALRVHREAQATLRGAVSLDGLVFTTENGHPVHGTNLTPVLRAALAAAGLPPVTVHDLRHSSATLLYSAGVAIETIADILGHSTPRITAELYRHRVPQMQRDAADRLAAVLG